MIVSAYPTLAKTHLDHSEQVAQQSGLKQSQSSPSSPRNQELRSNPQRTAGIVQSVTGEMLALRLADGTCQTFTVESSLLSSRPLRKGTLVVVDTDNASRVTRIQTPEAEKTVAGVVTAIVEDQVTLQLPNGETEGTTIAPETISRLRLKPGVPVVVTTYQGIPVTRVCLGDRPRLQPPVITPPPAPAPPPPVPALW